MKVNNGDIVEDIETNDGDSLLGIAYQNNIMNPYMNMNNHRGTHEVMDNISQQFIQSNGMVGYFLPRSFGDVDRLFGEELEVNFKHAWQFSFYLESYTGFDGMGSVFGYGGLGINDEMKIMINPSLFQHQCEGAMPEMGDWVYLPKDNSLFEVRYVDPYNKFYQYGKQSQYFLILSKVVYNQEEIDPEIQNNLNFNLYNYDENDFEPLRNLDGRLDTHIDEFATSDYIQKEAEEVIVNDSPVTGSGHKLPKGENSKRIESLEDIQNILGGR